MAVPWINISDGNIKLTRGQRSAKSAKKSRSLGAKLGFFRAIFSPYGVGRKDTRIETPRQISMIQTYALPPCDPTRRFPIFEYNDTPCRSMVCIRVNVTLVHLGASLMSCASIFTALRPTVYILLDPHPVQSSFFRTLDSSRCNFSG